MQWFRALKQALAKRDLEILHAIRGVGKANFETIRSVVDGSFVSVMMRLYWLEARGLVRSSIEKEEPLWRVTFRGVEYIYGQAV